MGRAWTQTARRPASVRDAKHGHQFVGRRPAAHGSVGHPRWPVWVVMLARPKSEPTRNSRPAAGQRYRRASAQSGPGVARRWLNGVTGRNCCTVSFPVTVCTRLFIFSETSPVLREEVFMLLASSSRFSCARPPFLQVAVWWDPTARPAAGPRALRRLCPPFASAHRTSLCSRLGIRRSRSTSRCELTPCQSCCCGQPGPQ